MKMLKCDFHAHTKDDPKDLIYYSAKDLIDGYARQHFDVVAITLHDTVYSNPELTAYAKGKGILLVPGVEAFLEGKKHVVIIGISQGDLKSLKTLDDLRALRRRYAKARKPLLVIAPHPFYPGKSCLHDVLVQNPDCFDAIESSSYYLPFMNMFNKRAREFAKAKGIPMVGMGDVHHLATLGHTYSMIAAKRNLSSIAAAIKTGRTQVHSSPMPPVAFARSMYNLFAVTPRHPSRKRQKPLRVRRRKSI